MTHLYCEPIVIYCETAGESLVIFPGDKSLSHPFAITASSACKLVGQLAQHGALTARSGHQENETLMSGPDTQMGTWRPRAVTAKHRLRYIATILRPGLFLILFYISQENSILPPNHYIYIPPPTILFISILIVIK